MKIGIDGNEANGEVRVGVHQYAFEIIKGLYNENKSRIVRHEFIIYLKNSPVDDLPKENDWWKYKVLKGRRIWILARLMPHLLLNPEVEVLFVPSHYTPIVTRIPIVCTIHDLGYLDSTEQFKKYDFWQLKYWTAKSISVSKNIICVSNSTRNEIVRHYPTASKKAKVIHHGYDKKRFNTKIPPVDVRRIAKKYLLGDDYILFLSTLKPSKNIDGLIRAFSHLKSNTEQKNKLVIAGKKGWMYKSIFNLVKELGLVSDVIFTGFISEKEKPALYYGACVFVLPVFWEGFGMTALESMACGTPVVVSRVGGLPEVVEDAGYYVDPTDKKDISLTIDKVLNLDKREYSKLVKKGFKQADKFSWEKAAKETLEVLEKLIPQKL